MSALQPWVTSCLACTAQARHHRPINILGGYKFPNEPDVQLGEEKKSSFSGTTFPKPDGDLVIPIS